MTGLILDVKISGGVLVTAGKLFAPEPLPPFKRPCSITTGIHLVFLVTGPSARKSKGRNQISFSFFFSFVGQNATRRENTQKKKQKKTKKH